MKIFQFFSLIGLVYGNIRDCGKENTILKITELSQSPKDYIKPEQNFSLTLKYEVPEGIEILDGTAETSVSLNFIPMGTTTDSLCSKMECPLEPGMHDGSTWALFPSGVTGTLVSKINWYDEKKNHLLCIESSIKATSNLRKQNIVKDILKRIKNPIYMENVKSESEDYEKERE